MMIRFLDKVLNKLKILYKFTCLNEMEILNL